MKTIIKYILPFILVLGTIICVNGQDVHFSQYFSTPLHTNPAQTGYFKGDWRVAGIYRNQWKAISGNAYNSFAVSYDRQDFYYSEQINSGVLLISDQSGTIAYTKNKAYLSGSYLKRIAGHKIAFGMQPGIVNIATSPDKHTYDNQFDLGNPDGVFNPDFSNGEENLINSRTYFDMNLGLLWSKRLNSKMRPTAGFALHHITTPNESLNGEDSDESKLPMRTIMHGMLEYRFTNKIFLIPTGMYSVQKKATEILIGGNAEYLVNTSIIKSVYAGPHFRYGWEKNFDASVWVFGTKFMNFDVAISYDINVSTLSEATNNRGAFEISLIYISDNTKPTKIQIPCDRL